MLFNNLSAWFIISLQSGHSLRKTMDRLTEIARLMIVSDLDHTMVSYGSYSSYSIFLFRGDYTNE